MAETRTITVHAWDDFEVPVLNFMAELKALFEQIPEQYQLAAVIEYDRYGSDYDTSRGELSLHYERPLTAGEIEEQRRSREVSERDELERLRRNYERLKARLDGRQGMG